MKKAIFIMGLMLLFGCKTKELTLSKSLDEVKTNLIEEMKTDHKAEVKSNSEFSTAEVNELVSLLQNLDISYNGQELASKLDVLLKKTDEGTVFTVQGNGQVNYRESSKKEFESMKAEIFKRQDSLYNLQYESFNSFKADIYKFSKQKEKEVKVQGFQAGTYITIGIVLIVLIILAWIAKRFKLFSKLTNVFKTERGAA